MNCMPQSGGLTRKNTKRPDIPVFSQNFNEKSHEQHTAQNHDVYTGERMTTLVCKKTQFFRPFSPQCFFAQKRGSCLCELACLSRLLQQQQQTRCPRLMQFIQHGLGARQALSLLSLCPRTVPARTIYACICAFHRASTCVHLYSTVRLAREPEKDRRER